MKQTTAKKIIENELYQLDIAHKSIAYESIFKNAMEAASVMTKKELIFLINEHAIFFTFEEKGH